MGTRKTFILAGLAWTEPIALTLEADTARKGVVICPPLGTVLKFTAV